MLVWGTQDVQREDLSLREKWSMKAEEENVRIKGCDNARIDNNRSTIHACSLGISTPTCCWIMGTNVIVQFRMLEPFMIISLMINCLSFIDILRFA